MDHYLTACYFVLTVFTTVGFGDMSAFSNGEICYVILVVALAQPTTHVVNHVHGMRLCARDVWIDACSFIHTACQRCTPTFSVMPDTTARGVAAACIIRVCAHTRPSLAARDDQSAHAQRNPDSRLATHSNIAPDHAELEHYAVDGKAFRSGVHLSSPMLVELLASQDMAVS